MDVSSCKEATDIIPGHWLYRHDTEPPLFDFRCPTLRLGTWDSSWLDQDVMISKFQWIDLHKWSDPKVSTTWWLDLHKLRSSCLKLALLQGTDLNTLKANGCDLQGFWIIQVLDVLIYIHMLIIYYLLYDYVYSYFVIWLWNIANGFEDLKLSMKDPPKSLNGALVSPYREI